MNKQLFTVFRRISNKITANKRNKYFLIGLDASSRNFTKCQFLYSTFKNKNKYLYRIFKFILKKDFFFKFKYTYANYIVSKCVLVKHFKNVEISLLKKTN